MAVYQTLLAYCAPSQPAHKVRGAISNDDVRVMGTPRKVKIVKEVAKKDLYKEEEKRKTTKCQKRVHKYNN